MEHSDHHRFETQHKLCDDFGPFFFAFANAGVAFAAIALGRGVRVGRTKAAPAGLEAAVAVPHPDDSTDLGAGQCD